MSEQEQKWREEFESELRSFGWKDHSFRAYSDGQREYLDEWMQYRWLGYSLGREHSIELEQQLSASEEARKKAEANCELYAAEMSEAKAAGWYSAQELFDAYKKLVAELAKLREQEPIAVVEEVGKMPDGTTVFNSSGNVQVGDQLYAAPVPPADVVELEARSEQWARLYNSADNDANEYAHKNTLLQAHIAMKDEALKAAQTIYVETVEVQTSISEALSATSESTEKFLNEVLAKEFDTAADNAPDDASEKYCRTRAAELRAKNGG